MEENVLQPPRRRSLISAMLPKVPEYVHGSKVVRFVLGRAGIP